MVLPLSTVEMDRTSVGSRRISDTRLPSPTPFPATTIGLSLANWVARVTAAWLFLAAAGVSTGFPELFEYCSSLMLDDGPAIEDRAVRSKLANWAVKASGLKYTSMRAISALSKGERPGPENSIGKLVAGSMIQDVATYALDLQGASGVVSGEDGELAGRFQAMLLRAPGTRVEGGTDEIMRNIIAERVLGLPGDIRVDKDVPFNKIPTKGRG